MRYKRQKSRTDTSSDALQEKKKYKAVVILNINCHVFRKTNIFPTFRALGQFALEIPGIVSSLLIIYIHGRT